MPGFDCQFIEEPAQYLQTRCPICLLILREPSQVTCCGKSFCRQCIQRVRAGDWPCPTCNGAKFDSFQNKGLQQPLYGFRVFCSNKESGCDWQGELGQLDQHLNLDPDKDKLLVGCAYTKVKCIYCNEPYPRHEIEHHKTSECAERPFTCSLCEEYESTCADVVTNHSPVCKCRPVECPNSCGTNNLQHQHLEEHISTQCPLSYVECEFSDAGCDAKMYRKDLPSHLGENMVTHMSLLARENRKQKQQLKEQQEAHSALEKEVQVQRDNTNSFLFCVPPIELCPDLQRMKPGHALLSKPFYSHIGGYKLTLELHCISEIPSEIKFLPKRYKYKSRYNILDSEFKLPPLGTLTITSQVTINHEDQICTFKQKVDGKKEGEEYIFECAVCDGTSFNVSHVS